jgi:very-short-patch-repair endonuclease
MLLDRDTILASLAGHNLELVTPGDLTTETIITIRCNIHNYMWNIKGFTLHYSDAHCRLCGSNAPSMQEVEKLIVSKNGTFIERIPKKAVMWYRIRCNIHNEHVWDMQWKALVRRNSWCSLCNAERQKVTVSTIKALVKERGGKLLAECTSGFESKLTIQCGADNYVWETSYNVISQGSWCPKCSNVAPHTYEEVSTLITGRGGILLDDSIGTVREYVNIECNCSNRFKMLLSNLIIGHWCSACAPKQKTQKEVFRILREIFPTNIIHYNYREFEWLKFNESSIDPLELDLWLPELKLAIEYDGQQHYKATKWYSSMTDQQADNVFKYQQLRDRRKNELIEEHKDKVEHFIRIKYTEPISKHHILKRLAECGLLKTIL